MTAKTDKARQSASRRRRREAGQVRREYWATPGEHAELAEFHAASAVERSALLKVLKKWRS